MKHIATPKLCELCVVAEPGLHTQFAEENRDGAESASVWCAEETGRPSSETAPSSGRGATQVPERGGTHHTAAAVRLTHNMSL